MYEIGRRAVQLDRIHVLDNIVAFRANIFLGVGMTPKRQWMRDFFDLSLLVSLQIVFVREVVKGSAQADKEYSNQKSRDENNNDENNRRGNTT